MRLVLDTHVFIWLNEAPKKISQQMITMLSSPENDLFLSLVSLWEMQIKIQLGKLQLQDPLPDILATQQSENNLQILPIHLDHIWALAELPNHHRDPFDRLLIAQLIATQVPIVSADAIFDRYPIQQLW
ncbi:MAG TPA: type II toxin-antitoxin system VapC family toxin [Leptolyngbya sp.]|jgi:PIN domain nuclease of toxin-antitoxin system|nr:type II toxin-antitoxin system VapC family toxin [Leptolyngbya sp.]